MAKKNARAEEEIKAEADPSPMIDCCFLLLMFFIVNAAQITVSKDPSVNMPNAVSASDMKDAKGCIVVNVFADHDKVAAKEKFDKTYGNPGVVWGVSDENLKPRGFTRSETQALSDFIKAQRELMESNGIKPEMIRLYLRGDANAPWERSSAVIAEAAKAGVSNVVFGALPADH